MFMSFNTFTTIKLKRCMISEDLLLENVTAVLFKMLTDSIKYCFVMFCHEKQARKSTKKHFLQNKILPYCAAYHSQHV